ncbi:MAG: glycoside hydrolase family 3 protein, partial [Lentisphaerae bacterium]|nr:glycoside hydrolase family 3 protein [Lentisphaerota bacterium]
MSSNDLLYRDASAPVEDRVRDLLSRMTLSEKLRQMGMADSARFLIDGCVADAMLRTEIGAEGIGAVQDARLAPNPQAAARVISTIQRFLATETRLGIPALVIGECLHGHMSVGATVFPQAIGLASTWNAELVENVASAAALEASSVGVNQALAPDLDLARDPRWGRVEETYGEDPYLCERLGVAYVFGVQGRKEVVGPDHLIATPKHFAAHGSPQAGINLAPVAAGQRELHSVYLPPFKAAVMEAGALSVMPAYSELDGVPCSASQELLECILREKWGFDGYTFADYGAIQMLHSFHRTAGDLQEAGRQAVMAGLDLEAPTVSCYGERLQELVEEERVPLARVDAAVSRILRVKFLAGLFEDDFDDSPHRTAVVNCPENVALALKVARESIVLLKNDGALLPLSAATPTIAVIGPNADTAQLGDYSVEKQEAVTALQGIRHAVSSQTTVHFAPGCGVSDRSEEG